MDNTETNTAKYTVQYYEYNTSAYSVLEATAELIKTPFPTVELVDRAVSLLYAARVMLISYDIEKANHESQMRAIAAAEAAKTAQQLEKDSAEVFGA